MKKISVLVIIMLCGIFSTNVSAQNAASDSIASNESILVKIFEEVRALPNFGYTELPDNDFLDMPEEVGKGVMTGYGNADPRETVEKILSTIPSEYRMIEARNERNKVRSLWLDKSDESNPVMLFFIAGNGGNDTVVVLWRNGKLPQIEQSIEAMRQDLQEGGYQLK